MYIFSLSIHLNGNWESVKKYLMEERKMAKFEDRIFPMNTTPRRWKRSPRPSAQSLSTRDEKTQEALPGAHHRSSLLGKKTLLKEKWIAMGALQLPLREPEKGRPERHIHGQV